MHAFAICLKFQITHIHALNPSPQTMSDHIKTGRGPSVPNFFLDTRPKRPLLITSHLSCLVPLQVYTTNALTPKPYKKQRKCDVSSPAAKPEQAIWLHCNTIVLWSALFQNNDPDGSCIKVHARHSNVPSQSTSYVHRSSLPSQRSCFRKICGRFASALACSHNHYTYM